MNKIKNNFSIKDLENLSGIKAHTIRIWEKRYNLLQPNRTDTNIRFYSLASLQKILNISYLNTNGYKISKIAKLNDQEIKDLVHKIASEQSIEHHYINQVKLCMMNFDKIKFYEIYDELSKQYSFKDIFFNIFVPLLDEIGLLWQTDTITPAHEHFIVELIKQKILIHTEKEKINLLSSNESDYKTLCVLFLPDNEVHELGLLYAYLELTTNKNHTIYLGQSVPIDALHHLLKYYKDITFLTSFTVSPEKENLDKYLEEFHSKILENNSNKLYISGRLTAMIDEKKLPNNISVYKTTKEAIEAIKENIS